MLKCDFNKLQSNFIEIALRHGCSPVNLLHIFRTPFPRNTSWWLLLITKFLFLTLTLDNFLFNGIHYLQKIVFAIGAIYASNYTNIFVGKFEKHTFIHT